MLLRVLYNQIIKKDASCVITYIDYTAAFDTQILGSEGRSIEKDVSNNGQSDLRGSDGSCKSTRVGREHFLKKLPGKTRKCVRRYNLPSPIHPDSRRADACSHTTTTARAKE